jgi:ribonuclease BN (tRNA processing enzyme)
MRVTLWGTRGSLAVPGPETIRYGGNTSCVELISADGTRLILDAGTGLRRLGGRIGPEAGRVDLLLTHLHMDHLQGLGFFGPLDRPGQEVHIWGPPSTTLDLRARLSRYLSPPLFPIRLRELPCELETHDVPLATFDIGAFRITAALVCHPGPTVGYRIEADGALLAYIPDHEPLLGARELAKDSDWVSGFELAQGVDLLIHDAQYSVTEYAQRVGWGHSTIADALTFAARAGVRRLVPFHHDPGHDDAALDRLVDEARAAAPASCEVVAGTEGASFDLGRVAA